MPVPSFDGAGIFLMDDFLVVSSSDDDIEYHGHFGPVVQRAYVLNEFFYLTHVFTPSGHS